MRIRVRSILFGLLGLIVVLVIGAITAVGWEIVLGPKARPVTDRTFAVSDVRMARGQYLVNDAGVCFHCHTEHDVSQPNFPRNEARRGAGWQIPIPDLGQVVAPNITPDRETGIGAWTDDEIARAIQEGVSRDGRALFPVMPYMNFRNLTDEDLASVVVYLRSIPPVRSELPKTELVFPLNLIVNTMPVPLTSRPPEAARTTSEARGEYLATTVIGCQDCHTPSGDSGPLPGLEFAGGGLFHDPGNDMKEVFSKNITPDPSGIAHYDEALFGQVLRTGQIGGTILNHIMPFENLRNLTADDMHDLYSFIRALPAKQHRVSNSDPPTLCPLCGQRHGLGDLNVRKGN